MSKDVLKDVKEFAFLENFLESPYTKNSEKEFTKASLAFISTILIVSLYSYFYFFTKNFNPFSVLSIGLYIFGVYSLFYSIIFFCSYQKTKNYSFSEAYKDLLEQHDNKNRFVLLEYMSAMRTVANLIISNTELNNHFYKEIDKIESVLNLFNPIVGHGYQAEFNHEADLYVQESLLSDMSETLPIIAQIQSHLLGENNENVFHEFLDEVISSDD